MGTSASRPAAFSDAACKEWFAGLEKEKKAKVRKAVAGKSTELDLRRSKFTQIPHGVFVAFQGLTTLDLDGCESLAALPESLGQL